MEKSKKKTKILISAILLGIFLIGAVVSIVLVLAANTQNVASNITVSYNAEGVAAKVSANYAVVPNSGTVTKTAMTTSGGGQEITFNLSTSESTETISPAGDIELNPQNQTVVFEYVFENLAETAFSLALSARPTGTNMTEKFLVTGVALDSSDYATAITSTTALPVQAVTYLGQKVYVYIMASVTNENLTASYNGGFAWNMIAQTKASYSVTLNNGSGTGGRTSLPVISTSTVSGIMMPSISTLPTLSQSGYVFTGYYDSESGGTQYYDSYGSPLAVAVSAATTLYAQYIQIATIEETAEGVVVTSVSDEAIYMSTETGTTFSYGGSEYESNGEYLMLEPDQSVTLPSTTTYANDSTLYKSRPSNFSEKKFYAAYGAYPQTYVGNELNETLLGGDLTATGKTYNIDVAGIETTLFEYEYGGVKYAKLDSSDYSGDGIFSTGESIATATTYFFIVEPIVVKAMEVTGIGAKVMSVNILGMKVFKKSGDAEVSGYYDNSWQNSDIRAHLNGTFLSESGLLGIAQAISITNEDIYNTSDYDANTTDKIWLPSAEEIILWSGSGSEGFETYKSEKWLNDENNSYRKAIPSDMARATGCNYNKTNDAGSYYLRSSGEGYDYVSHVYWNGSVEPYANYADVSYGFAPAFYINL